jgi:hypothetical protein
MLQSAIAALHQKQRAMPPTPLTTTDAADADALVRGGTVRVTYNDGFLPPTSLRESVACHAFHDATLRMGGHGAAARRHVRHRGRRRGPKDGAGVVKKAWMV